MEKQDENNTTTNSLLVHICMYKCKGDRSPGNKHTKQVIVITLGGEGINIGRMVKGDFSFIYTPFSFYKEHVIIYNFKKLLPTNDSLVRFMVVHYVYSIIIEAQA